MLNIVYDSVWGVAVDKAQRCAQREKQAIPHICCSYVMLLVSENVNKIRPIYEPRYEMPCVGNVATLTFHASTWISEVWSKYY
jgi:hypothetical protein